MMSERFLNVPQDDFEQNFDAWCAKVRQGLGPIIIKGNDGQDLILFKRSDYEKRFSEENTKSDLEIFQEAYEEYLKSGRKSTPVSEFWKELDL